MSYQDGDRWHWGRGGEGGGYVDDGIDLPRFRARTGRGRRPDIKLARTAPFEKKKRHIASRQSSQSPQKLKNKAIIFGGPNQ